jgi:mitotic spindle assembly checkpoint protein MAD2B
MATPPTLLTNYQSILQTFTDFLTVAIHTILYERALYPSTTFISTRKYNFPVRQNRHPKVCSWINDAVSNISALLLKGTVRRVVVVIYNRDLEVMERFLFDIERFPVVDPKEALTEFEAREGQREMRISVTDVEEQLRGTIRRLSYACNRMGPLPEGCTYTVAVELRDQADPPIGVSSGNLELDRQALIFHSTLNPGSHRSRVYKLEKRALVRILEAIWEV